MPSRLMHAEAAPVRICACLLVILLHSVEGEGQILWLLLIINIVQTREEWVGQPFCLREPSHIALLAPCPKFCMCAYRHKNSRRFVFGPVFVRSPPTCLSTGAGISPVLRPFLECSPVHDRGYRGLTSQAVGPSLCVVPPLR